MDYNFKFNNPGLELYVFSFSDRAHWSLSFRCQIQILLLPGKIHLKHITLPCFSTPWALEHFRTKST